MIEYIADPLQYSFMIRGLLVSALVGVMCPLVGAYVITRGLAFMGDALAHAVLPGMVIGVILGLGMIAAVPSGIAVALLIGFVSRRSGISEDTAIGILFAGMFALGLVMLSASTGIKVNIEDFLLGQPLAVSWSEVYTALALTGVVIVGLYMFHHQLVLTSFDPAGAKVVGVRTTAIENVLLVLLSLVIVVGILAVGIVLVMAMLITPAATAYILVRRFVSMMVVGAIIGVASAVAGLYISYYLNLPSGPVMTLVATGIFVVAVVARRVPRLSSYGR